MSDLSTMTLPSWVAPRAWLSFIELDKAVVHVIMVSVCLALLQHLQSHLVSLTLDTTAYETGNQREHAVQHKALYSVLFGDQNGKKILKKEEIYVYIQLIHFAVQQKHNIVKQLYTSEKKFKNSRNN